MLVDYNKNYEAKIEAYGINTTKGGDPQPYIKFAITDETDKAQSVYWHGSFKEGKAQEIAIKSLLTAGFIGEDSKDLNSEGMFKAKELSVKLEEHNYNGKTTIRVKFINEKKAAPKFAGNLPKLSGAFTKARKDMGVSTQTMKSEEEVPF